MTPGPWAVGPHQRIISSGWSIRIADGSAIAYVLGEKNPELQANARLISKVPEMLALLKRSLEPLDKDASLLHRCDVRIFLDTVP